MSGMKQARPTEAEFHRVFKFLWDLENIMDYGEMPDDFDRCSEDREATIDRVDRWLAEEWRGVGHLWQRVLMAGKVAMDNACDPSLPHLEFKPEIVKGLELLAAQKGPASHG